MQGQGRIRIIACQSCSGSFEARTRRGRYCKECRKLKIGESNRRSMKRLRAKQQTKVKTCRQKDCNDTFTGSRNRQFCNEHSQARKGQHKTPKPCKGLELIGRPVVATLSLQQMPPDKFLRVMNDVSEGRINLVNVEY